MVRNDEEISRANGERQIWEGKDAKNSLGMHRIAERGKEARFNLPGVHIR